MQKYVAAAADQDPVLYRCLASIRPVRQMMHIQPACRATTRYLATAVASLDGSTDRQRPDPCLAPDAQDLARVIGTDHGDAGIAAETTGGLS